MNPFEVPESLPCKDKKHASALVLLVLGLVLLLCIGAYALLNSSYGVLHTVRYLSGPFETRSLQQTGWLRPSAVAIPVPGRVVDYARSGCAEAAIALTDDGTETVYRTDGSVVAITTDSGVKTVKSSLDIAPDGSYIAYAVRTATTTPANPSEFYNPASWEIMLAQGKGYGSLKTVGVGYSPHFFNRGGDTFLMFTSTSTIHIANLTKDSSQDLPVQFGRSTSYRAATISSDGSYLALPDIANGYALYALEYSNATYSLRTAGALPQGTDLVAFSGNSIVSTAHNTANALLRISSVYAPGKILHARTLKPMIVFKLIP